MSIRSVVLVVCVCLLFAFCVVAFQGCAFSLVDGSRQLDFEVFMPYEDSYEVEELVEDDQVEDDLDLIYK